MSKKKNRPYQSKSAQVINNTVATADVKPTQDAFTNAAARLGYGMTNTAEGAGYVNERLGRNYGLMNTLYRTNWIIGKIVDLVAEDMTKGWIDIRTASDPEVVEKIKRNMVQTQVKSKILEGVKWGRLYGGAVALIMIDGHENELDQPLDLDMVMPGSFKGLMILDRWSGVYPQLNLINDLNDPEFGLPDFYQITSDAKKDSILVHHSRVLRFIGQELPMWERRAEQYWGSSVIERAYEEVKRRDNTGSNIESLVFMANLRVLKLDGMGQALTTGNQQMQDRLFNTITAQNQIMSSMGVQVMDPKDSFETHQYTFSGLSDVYQSFMMDVSGATGIPVTKLFGRSPAGMNATGEGDMNNYYDMIEVEQESKLRPIIDKLLPVIFVSEFGVIPDDLEFVFNPVRRPSDQEKISMGKDRATSILEVYNTGLIPDKTALQELREMSDVTGMWTNITDEMINNASETVEPKGELPLESDPFAQEPQDADMTFDNKWITIHPNEGTGRKVLLNESGEIIGGSIPKSAQGKHISSAFKKETKTEQPKESSTPKLPELTGSEAQVKMGTEFRNKHIEETKNTKQNIEKVRENIKTAIEKRPDKKEEYENQLKEVESVYESLEKNKGITNAGQWVSNEHLKTESLNKKREQIAEHLIKGTYPEHTEKSLSEYPKLEGTEKQVSWAENIRSQYVTTKKDELKRTTGYSYTPEFVDAIHELKDPAKMELKQKEIKEKYPDKADQIIKNLKTAQSTVNKIEEMKTTKSAKWIIENK